MSNIIEQRRVLLAHVELLRDLLNVTEIEEDRISIEEKLVEAIDKEAELEKQTTATDIMKSWTQL
jgi:hypothetical protein